MPDPSAARPSRSSADVASIAGLGAALDACLQPLLPGYEDGWRAAVVEQARGVIGPEAAAAGDPVVLARFADLLATALRTLDEARGVRAEERDDPARAGGDGSRRRQRLTDREHEVALLIAEGRSAKEIARSLALSVHTVRRHTEKIFSKLGVSTRARVGPAMTARGERR